VVAHATAYTLLGLGRGRATKLQSRDAHSVGEYQLGLLPLGRSVGRYYHTYRAVIIAEDQYVAVRAESQGPH